MGILDDDLLDDDLFDDDLFECEKQFTSEARDFNYPMFGVDKIFYNYVYEDADGIWTVIEDILSDGRFSVVHADTALDAVYIAFEYIMKDGKRMNIIAHEFFSGDTQEYDFDMLRKSYKAWSEDYDQRMYSRQSRSMEKENERGLKGFINRFL